METPLQERQEHRHIPWVRLTIGGHSVSFSRKRSHALDIERAAHHTRLLVGHPSHHLYCPGYRRSHLPLALPFPSREERSCRTTRLHGHPDARSCYLSRVNSFIFEVPL